MNRAWWGKTDCYYVWVVLAAAAFHFPLLWVGHALSNSDYAFMIQESASFLRKGWTPFFVGQNYGGTLLSLFRPLFPGGPHFFSYIVCPALISVAGYFFLKSFLSLRAARWTALFLSMGTGFLTHQYGNDFYIAYMILGLILLGLRLRWGDPWEMTSPLRLFGLSVLSGLVLYVFRGSLIFVVAAWLPSAQTLRAMPQVLRGAKGGEKGLVVLAGALSVFFGYLWFFGETLGDWGGRPVKLSAEPNLKFAGMILVLLFIRHHWREGTGKGFKAWGRRFCWIGLGLLVGFSPEFISCLAREGWIPGGGSGGLASFSHAARSFGKLPGVMAELVDTDTSLDRIFPRVALGVSFYLLLVESVYRPNLRVLVSVFALSICAYCGIAVYDDAPARYLFPIFPALLAGYGVAISRGLRSRGWAVAISIVMLGAAFHTLRGRMAQVYSSALNQRQAEIEWVAARVKNAEVDLVLTNDYWETHQYALPDLDRLHFYISGGLNPRATLDLVHEVRRSIRLAALWDLDQSGQQEKVFTFNQRDVRMKKVGSTSHRTLWVAEEPFLSEPQASERK